MMSWRGFLASLSIVLAACGGDGPSGPIGGGGFGTLSAVIDGVPWSAPGIYQTASAQEAGTFTFGGSNGIQGTTLALTLKYISAPGTYPLGVGSPVPGGGATLTVSAPASGFWWSALTGASGTVTVSSVSATNIAGTFNFTASPVAGTGTAGNKSVTQGQFNINFPAPGSLTIPPGVGSTFTGTLNGQAWNAATIVSVTHPSSGTLTIGASNDGQMVNMTIGGFAGAGTYTLGTGVVRTMQVSNVGTTLSWGGTQANSAGTVIVTAYNANRIQGTYTATLSGNGSTAGIATLSGSFNVGFPQ